MHGLLVRPPIFLSWLAAQMSIREQYLAASSAGIYVVMWNFMGWEFPTAAGDEIINPKKTYPRAMALVFVAAILSYSIPTLLVFMVALVKMAVIRSGGLKKMTR